jgi:hypothetical protein
VPAAETFHRDGADLVVTAGLEKTPELPGFRGK